jgi:type IV pilus assembly protein PilO
MDFQELTEKINSFDVNDIDWSNMGSWPLLGRVIFAVVVFIGIVVGLYFVDIQGLSEEFDGIVKNETTLKKSFESKAFKVANLDA